MSDAQQELMLVDPYGIWLLGIDILVWWEDMLVFDRT